MTAAAAPAVALCALVLIAIIAALVWVSSRLAPHEPPYEPRHQSGRTLGPVARPPVLADPADVTDPDGTAFLEQLKSDLPRRHRKAPAKIVPFGGDVDPATLRAELEKVRDALLNLPDRPPVVLPEFHPAPGCGDAPADPADTGSIPAAVGTWGMDAAELASQLAAEHLGVKL